MINHKQPLFKEIPSVDRLLMSPRLEGISISYPRSLVLKAIHQVLDNLRMNIHEGKILEVSELSLESVSNQVVEMLKKISRPSLRPVIQSSVLLRRASIGWNI